MKSIVLEIAKTENKKRVKVGEVAIVVPILDDIVSHVAGAKITGEEDGLPTYDNDPANWVMSAIVAYTKASARNKLVPGTADLKDGAKIATNWEELCAEGDRNGNGAALQLAREVKDAFAKWVATLGKNEATQKIMVQYFSVKTALELATKENKAKMLAYVEQFAESLDEATAERYARPLENVAATCATDTGDF
jgi:hypothetical protein